MNRYSVGLKMILVLLLSCSISAWSQPIPSELLKKIGFFVKSPIRPDGPVATFFFIRPDSNGTQFLATAKHVLSKDSVTKVGIINAKFWNNNREDWVTSGPEFRYPDTSLVRESTDSLCDIVLFNYGGLFTLTSFNSYFLPQDIVTKKEFASLKTGDSVFIVGIVSRQTIEGQNRVEMKRCF